eukprot:s99_g4.t1
MLSACLPKMVKDEVAFKDLMNFLTSECLTVLREGVKNPHNGETYRCAVLQVVGDWMFLQKAGNLSRSYANVEKRPRGKKSIPKGICHLCRAGQLQVPFEDLRMTAIWRQTMFDPSDDPFVARPVLLQIPHYPAMEPDFFTYDLWHACHLGMLKTFAASVLAMISQKMTGSNVEQRFLQLTAKYLDFCDSIHSSPYVLSITKESLGWPDTNTYPNAQWSKGHVSTLMMKFIQHYFENHACDETVDPLFPKCQEATISINKFMDALYASDLWIESNLALQIARLGERFLVLYMELATAAFFASRKLFCYMPKSHVVDHVVERMITDSQSSPWVVNPLAHAVQVDEDFVGKCCRVARKVGVGQSIGRVLQRSLMASYKHFVDNGYLRA